MDPTIEQLEARIVRLQKAFKNFSITGGDGITFEGNMFTGVSANFGGSSGGSIGGIIVITCPPAGHPTSITVEVDFDGTGLTGADCGETLIPVTADVSESVPNLAEFWQDDGPSCYAEGGFTTETLWICPAGCADDIERTASFGAILRYGKADADWGLEPYFFIGPVDFCGASFFIQFGGFGIDLGTSPVGTHVIEDTSSDGQHIQWTITIA